MLQTIQLNSTGSSVTNWQNFLISQGFTLGASGADGIFGNNTDAATKDFQTKQNLTADGIVGNSTYSAAMQLGFNGVLQVADFTGIDVYHGDGSIDWNQVKGDTKNIQFTYLKATEGTGYTDISFTGNRSSALAAGLHTGAYHFYHPELSPVSQANFFSQTISALQTNELPPALDFEPTNLNGTSAVQVIADILSFLKTVESSLGVQPIIYTNYNSWVNVLGNPSNFSNYKLWIAAYNGGVTLPGLFGGWTEWAIWQYTDSGSVTGINNNNGTDMNKYNVTSGLIQ